MSGVFNMQFQMNRQIISRTRLRPIYPRINSIRYSTLRPVVALREKRILKPYRLIARAIESDADSDTSMSDWPMNWSLASYEDLTEYYSGKLMKEEGMGGYHLSDIMTKDLILTKPDTPLDELKVLFEEHTGLPVVDGKNRLLGVVSRSDLEKRQGTVVKDIMSTPPIAAKPTARVADAACLMLKHKVHRIPIVSEKAVVIGFVTRTDIFEALEAETELEEAN